MRLLYIAIKLVLILPALSQDFDPFGIRLVQGISFSPDRQTLYFTLPYREYMKEKGVTCEECPGLAIFQSVLESTGWSEPELMPFSGKYEDYEPTISPDGSVLLFNSNRPLAGNEIESKNNIWFVELNQNRWSDEAKNLVALNTSDYEESYAIITAAGDLFYVREIPSEENNYQIFKTRFRKEKTKPGKQINLGLGNHADPWLSADGSLLIFTSWQEDWASECDLFFTKKTKGKWSNPKPLSSLNGDGPDFSPTYLPENEVIYFRRNYNMIRMGLKLESLN